MSFEVEQVIGIARSDSGRNTFEVEAKLDAELNALRPGMEGVGKIRVEPRNQLWIWTHGLLERVQLWLWRHWP